ncbi:hypothetical protein LMTR3_07880 [Bradyrhizobium sp. LMTR 3]|nr:hypothetical protein LMTR3_07880 [Bradyrhizobium sp. LMTR 3]
MDTTEWQRDPSIDRRSQQFKITESACAVNQWRANDRKIHACIPHHSFKACFCGSFRCSVDSARRQEVILTKGRSTVSAAPINEDCAQVNKMANARFRCAPGKVQRAIGIDRLVNVCSMLFARVMNSGCQMHHRIDTGERFCPVGVGTDIADHYRSCVGRGLSHSLSNDHAVTFQHGGKILAYEAIRTR